MAEPTHRASIAAGLAGLLGLLALVLTDCAGGGAAVPTGAVSTDPAGAPAYAAVTPAQNAAPQQPASLSGTTAGEYRISGRDIIDIQVFQVSDLTKTVQVSEDGTVTLPLVGKMHFGGKTTQEAEAALSDKLRQKYLQSPQVSILVKQFGQRVTVSGEVKSPKVLAIDGAVTLSQAIANAGGLSDLADPARIHIARSRNGRVVDAVYNLGDIQLGQAPDPTLSGGDIIVAEQSGSKVVLKNIKDLLPFAVLGSVL
jgi:polysaccharide export outer membrane protein